MSICMESSVKDLQNGTLLAVLTLIVWKWHRDEEGVVKNVKVGCNGNKKTVPLFCFLKKLDGKKHFHCFFLR